MVIKKQHLICLVFALSCWAQPLIGQEQKSNGAFTLTYTGTFDGHSGVLIGSEGFLNDHLFCTYALGLGRSHFFLWEYVANFDVGYRFRFHSYRPDIRIGYGYLFGFYDEGVQTTEYGIVDFEEMDVFITTSLKLGFLNWDLSSAYHIPIRLIANFGLQGQFLMESSYPEGKNAQWHGMVEAGIAYRFN